MDELFFYVNKNAVSQDICDKLCECINENKESFLDYISRENPDLRSVLIHIIQNTVDKYLEYYKNNGFGDNFYEHAIFPIIKINDIKMLKNDYNNKYGSFVKDDNHNNLNNSLIIIFPLNIDLTININDKKYIINKGDISIFPNIWSFLYSENITSEVEYVYLLKICSEEIM